jgi:hypothetical protein
LSFENGQDKDKPFERTERQNGGKKTILSGTCRSIGASGGPVIRVLRRRRHHQNGLPSDGAPSPMTRPLNERANFLAALS